MVQLKGRILSGLNFPSVIKRDKYLVAVIVVSTLFFCLYSAFSIVKFLSLDASGWDLGIHAQVLWSTLNGNLFYSPLIGENFLAEHFAPFEFLQLPIYYFFPSPVSLLIFQAFFVAFAAIPLYLISNIVLSGKIESVKILKAISLILAVSYLLSPYTISSISFDFHNISFLPFFLFLAFFAFLKEKRGLSIFSLIMIISLHSNFIFIAATILLYELFYLRTKEGHKIKKWLTSRTDAKSWQNFALFIVCIS